MSTFAKSRAASTLSIFSRTCPSRVSGRSVTIAFAFTDLIPTPSNIISTSCEGFIHSCCVFNVVGIQVTSVIFLENMFSPLPHKYDKMPVSLRKFMNPFCDKTVFPMTLLETHKHVYVLQISEGKLHVTGVGIDSNSIDYLTTNLNRL